MEIKYKFEKNLVKNHAFSSIFMVIILLALIIGGFIYFGGNFDNISEEIKYFIYFAFLFAVVIVILSIYSIFKAIKTKIFEKKFMKDKNYKLITAKVTNKSRNVSKIMNKTTSYYSFVYTYSNNDRVFKKRTSPIYTDNDYAAITANNDEIIIAVSKNHSVPIGV